MAIQLKIFLIICVLAFLFYVIKNVRVGKLSIKHALIWIIMSIAVIVCILCVDPLSQLAALTGVQTFANLIFFLGFIFLLFVTFSLTRTVTENNQKINKLNQEIALLKKKLKDHEK